MVGEDVSFPFSVPMFSMFFSNLLAVSFSINNLVNAYLVYRIATS